VQQVAAARRSSLVQTRLPWTAGVLGGSNRDAAAAAAGRAEAPAAGQAEALTAGRAEMLIEGPQEEPAHASSWTASPSRWPLFWWRFGEDLERQF
jgi:hypothetical protein